MSQKKALISALLTSAAILGCSSAAFAESPGFYAGVQLGYGEQYISNPNLQSAVSSGLVAISSTTNSDTKGGLGGGADIGWQFNDWFGLELGYLYFPNSEFSSSATGVDAFINSTVNSADVTSKEQLIDLMLKASIPFGACFGGYVKAGPAYVQNKLNFSATSSTATAGGIVTNSISGDDTNNKIKPIAAAGFTYDINDNVTVDLSYTYLFGSSSSNSSFANFGSNSSNIPRAGLVALGITYYFGGYGSDDI